MSDKSIAIRNDVEIFNSSLPVTQGMIDALKEQRKLLGDFVRSQLKKDVDYGIIPGVKQTSLFKPGAEKIRGLFGLNVKLDCTFQTIEGEKNFAMFTYKATVYHGDKVISECEGSTNSQEKKFKERTVWVYNPATKKKEPKSEATPIFDILNTLQKMAQKRAMVGAIIMAVGASDFFTQDIDDIEDAKSIGIVPEEISPNIPKVVNVSSNPTQNIQNGNNDVLVEAIVTFDEKQMAKDAGFKWDKGLQKWIKTIKENERSNFPFEVENV